MKFTLSWLKEHLDTTATLDAIVEGLTRIGLEVEHVDNPGERLKAFTIAKVIEAKPHPNADRLRVCSVDTGAGAPVLGCPATRLSRSPCVRCRSAAPASRSMTWNGGTFARRAAVKRSVTGPT